VIIRSLKKELEELRSWEERAIQLEKEIREKIGRGERVAKNINVVHGERLTLGDRMADHLADLAGSWASSASSPCSWPSGSRSTASSSSSSRGTSTRTFC